MTRAGRLSKMKAETREPKMSAESQPQGQAERTSPLLVLISAPSGGGKTTLCQQLLAARPGMTRAVTCTTRPPREGEQDGMDYYFLDAASFLKRVQAGNFLEHATVLWPQLWHAEGRGAGQTAPGQRRAAQRGRAGGGDHPREGRRKTRN